MDCSALGFAVLHHLPELAQTPVHCVSDAIQPSCLLLFPSIFPRISKNRASLVAQLEKNPPAMQETLVRFLGREDPLEQE